MSCQARKKKSPRFLWCTRLPCEQLGKLTSGPGSSLPGSRRRGFPGESADLACSQVGAPPLPTPRPGPLRTQRTRPAASAPRTARCRLQRSSAESISIKDAPLPLFPLLGQPQPRGGPGQEPRTELGREIRAHP